jgi:hypothetical protein
VAAPGRSFEGHTAQIEGKSMASHVINFTLNTMQVFGLSLGLGIAIGIPVGVAAVEYGWSKGAARDNRDSQASAAQVTGKRVCINGFAYEIRRSEPDSPWHGVYKAVEQKLPTMYADDGGIIAEGSIPSSCGQKVY